MSEPFKVTDPEELEHAAAIVKRIQQIPLLIDRHNRTLSSPAPGSDLAGDDAATTWMNASHLVSASLTMATENMRAVGTLLAPQGELMVPMYAHYPILRSVLEAAALSKWILLPDDRTERIARVLRARTSDARHDKDLHAEEVSTIRAMGGAHEEALQRDEERARERYARDIAKIQSIATTHAIPWAKLKNGLPPWVHLIRDACAVDAGPDWIAVPGGYAAGMWKIMSGLSHPSTTRTVNHSAMDRLEDKSTDGTILARFSASLRWTNEAINVAWNTTQEALALHELRQHAHP